MEQEWAVHSFNYSLVITYSNTGKYLIVIFSSLSKRIFYHFPKLISQLTETAVQVFLGKGVLKICSKFKGEHPCRSVISIKLHTTLLKSHFSVDVLL